MTGNAARAKDGAEPLGAGGDVAGESLDGMVGLVGVAAVEGVGAIAPVPVTLMASF